MEAHEPHSSAVDNSELGPYTHSDEGYRPLREDIYTITKVLGGAVIGGCIDVARNGFKKLKGKIEEIDNSDLSKRNSKQRKGFTPDPGGVDDIPIYVSGSGIPVSHEVQEELR